MQTYTGFSSSQWNNWELKTSFPKFEDLLKISNLFEINVSDLIYLDLSKGGDYEKSEFQKSHKLYKNSGFYSGNDSGDYIKTAKNNSILEAVSVVNEEEVVYGNNRCANCSTNMQQTVTIRALQQTVEVQNRHINTLEALIHEMGKEDKIQSKHSKVG